MFKTGTVFFYLEKKNKHPLSFIKIIYNNHQHITTDYMHLMTLVKI